MIITYVHLSLVFVIPHFILRQFDSHLESNGSSVISSFDRLSHTTVGSIGTNEDIHGELKLALSMV